MTQAGRSSSNGKGGTAGCRSSSRCNPKERYRFLDSTELNRSGKKQRRGDMIGSRALIGQSWQRSMDDGCSLRNGPRRVLRCGDA